jgi:transcription antitermination factor NusG
MLDLGPQVHSRVSPHYMQAYTNEGPGEPSWHALYTRHQHEKIVAQILTSKGFEVFLPLYRAMHRWKDRNKELSLPLFPCYVFLKGGLHRRLDIVTTPGMYSFVGTQERAAVIPLAEIDAIRRATESSVRMEPHPFLKCGDRVRIKSGPLQGVEGFLVRKKNLYRLVLSVELLGRAASMEVDGFIVERLSSGHIVTASRPVSSRSGIQEPFPFPAR